ncbi:hypothetical protein [Yersinia pseudotuberculosis]|uniref:Uncharacterized protein n=1 Tax=Yersinia pseudotuberculosis TaxID=633 RepID=A0A380Q3V6_YERPU|nr:hypothetical protein [Yersinia pseudotuberculosis]CND69616.1 Uncharacterised protein [Yersinia pseudotuberculosis]SUP80500.1 Uncharacterised protein [Yersinia pseudotuberculosis]
MKNLIRVKWSRLKSNLTLIEIASYIKSNIYSETSKYGYSSFKTQDNVISATYTEAKINIQTSVDPLGNENEQEFISYESINFSISKLTSRLYLLSIYNPPKSIRALTDRLSTDSDYKIGFSTIDIRLSEYIKTLSEKHNMHLINIKKAKISSLVINENAKASIEITSKKNALEDIKSIINEKTYALDKIKASGHLLNSTYEFELSKNGTLCTSEEVVDYFTETIVNHILEREI